jgi:hypothetical protein
MDSLDELVFEICASLRDESRWDQVMPLVCRLYRVTYRHFPKLQEWHAKFARCVRNGQPLPKFSQPLVYEPNMPAYVPILPTTEEDAKEMRRKSIQGLHERGQIESLLVELERARVADGGRFVSC